MAIPPQPWPTGLAEQPEPLVRRVLAPNASHYTYTGTQTYLVGDARGVVVIDPGPNDPEHLAALAAAIAGAPVLAIACTHTHRDHSPNTARIKAATGATVYAEGPHRASRPRFESEKHNPESGSDRDFRPDTRDHDGGQSRGPGRNHGRDRDAGLTLNQGSVIRVVDMLPGKESPMHRTNSIDYGIVLEGEIDPNNFRQEGPFAEYTGYYTDELHKVINKPALEVKQILHRNNPVLWATGQGRPHEAGQHVAGAGRRQPLVTPGDHQHPAVGVGGHRGRALGQHHRPQVGGRPPGGVDPVGSRVAPDQAAQLDRLGIDELGHRACPFRLGDGVRRRRACCASPPPGAGGPGPMGPGGPMPMRKSGGKVLAFKTGGKVGGIRNGEKNTDEVAKAHALEKGKGVGKPVKRADGGKTMKHDDKAADEALIRKMVKPAAMKAKSVK